MIGDDELDRAKLDGVSIDVIAAEIDSADPLAATPIDRSQPSPILNTSGTSG